MNYKALSLLCLLILLAPALYSIRTIEAQTEPTVSLSPAQVTCTQVNQTFTVNITISNVQNLWAWDMNLTWNPASISLISAPTEGSFMRSAGSTLWVSIPQNATGGYIPDISDAFLENIGVNGSGTLATLQFQVISQASSSIQLNIIALEAPLPASEVGENGAIFPQITPTSTTATTIVTVTSEGAPVSNAVSLNPSQFSFSQVNQTFTVSITASNVQNLWGWVCNLTWNPTSLSLVGNPVEGSFMKQTGANTVFVAASAGNNSSLIVIADAFLTNTAVNGSGTLTSLEFQVINPTESFIQLSGITLEGPLPSSEVSSGYPHPQIVPAATSSTMAVAPASSELSVLNAGSNLIVIEGTTVTFNGSNISSLGLNDSWSFTYGDPLTLGGQTANYTFNQPGVYPVTYSVRNSSSVNETTSILIVQSSSYPLIDYYHNGTVNFNDVLYFATAYIQYYQTGYLNPACDLNNDGKLNFNDITLFIAAYVIYGQALAEGNS